MEDVKDVKDAVKELEGPGRLLGYRAMLEKVRQEFNLARRTLLSCQYIADQRSTDLRSKMSLTATFDVLVPLQ